MELWGICLLLIGGGWSFGVFVTVSCGRQSCEVFEFISVDTLGTP